MNLDPALAALLEGRGDRELPRLEMGESLEYLRAEFRSAKLKSQSVGSSRLGADLSAVSLVTDGPGGELEMRWYAPDPEVPAATVFFHGGGWVLGDLDTHDSICRRIGAIGGIGVLSVGYRLAPENPYPAALEDGVHATSWLLDNYRSLGVLEPRIGVAGTSAGGNIAACVAIHSHVSNRPYPLMAQLLAYPVLDPQLSLPSTRLFSEGYYLRTEDMRRFVAAYLPDPASRSKPTAAPLHAEALDEFPPTVLATAEFDPLRDESHLFAERLLEADVDVVFLSGAGLIHGYFGMVDASETARRVTDEAIAAFVQLLLR